MWEESEDQEDFWEDFTLKTSSLTPGKPKIKSATLTGSKDEKTCLVKFELPSNVGIGDSFRYFVSFR